MTDWIEYGKDFLQFIHEGLSKPGVLVQAKGRTFLIGDVNQVGGGCACCDDIASHDKIEWYKIVWQGRGTGAE
jgi:hypothetical protein